MRKIIIELDDKEANHLLILLQNRGTLSFDLHKKISQAIIDRNEGKFFQCSACHEDAPCQSS
jgi:hypothetical protein